MNKAKIRVLKETFEEEFDVERFKKFTREFFNEPEMLNAFRRTQIWREYADYVDAYHTIADYIDNEENKIKVLAVELKRNSSIDRARSMQRNFISKILDINNLEAAIVAFFNEGETTWRLSFVRLDYSFSEKGIELELTPARRFSYLVGENEPKHTALEQLLPIFEDDKHNPTLDEIESAFSVEKVTKDFFQQYKEKYLDLKEYLENDESFIMETKKLGFKIDKFSEQFAKKLMGQLTFLYFIQKKGWLGVRIMPKSHAISIDKFKKLYDNQDKAHKKILKRVFKKNSKEYATLSAKNLNLLNEHEAELLSDCFLSTEYDMPWGSGNKTFVKKIFNSSENSNKNFYNDYLEPLFYSALNAKRKNHYFKLFNCKIPFLNGGLFEPIEGYHWQDVNFEIPNKLFSNKTKKGREADGILDIFDRFNFTMNEDEPLEKEVAIDPEMLGKIFENLLDISDRKSKGAFYTPRRIVHFMCQESLINHLVNETGVLYEDIKEFILYGDLIKDEDSRRVVKHNIAFNMNKKIKQSIFDKIAEIDEALKKIRIADPAVGSGAFILGMLNEIVKARNNITEYIIRKDKERGFEERFGENFIRNRRSEYNMKLDTIKNCIFAVDIEPSAADITKLRIWLSLVVDQEIDNRNAEPHPLPNLDMNIHVGDSLIDDFEGTRLFDKSILFKSNDNLKNNDSDFLSNNIQLNLLMNHSDDMLNKMFKLQDRYFEEDNDKNKVDLMKRIDKIRDDLIRYKLSKDNNKKSLEKYEESLKKNIKPYFIWELEFAKVFKEKGGFDIVIGNPPYIGFHNVQNKEYYKDRFYSAKGKYDFYVLFIEKGIEILRRNGFVSFICPSYFYKRNYGRNIRKYILNNTSIKMISDFSDSQVFDSATTYTCIFGFEKNKKNKNNNIKIFDEDLKKNKFHQINQESLNEPVWLLEDSKEIKILNKIKSRSIHTFGSITESISQGIVTGNNSVYIISKNIIEKKKMNYNFLEPVYKGKNIKNGELRFSNEFVFYPYDIDKKGKNILIEEERLMKENPNLYAYLLESKDTLLNRDYFRRSNKKWFELWNPRKKQHFLNRKIVFSEISDKNDFVLCNRCFYSDSACGSELKDKHKRYEKYITKYLNSDIISKIYRKISVPKANGFLIYKNAFLKYLPIYIPKNIEEIYKDIINLDSDNFKEWLEKELEI